MQATERFKKLKEINHIKTNIYKTKIMRGFVNLEKTLSSISMAGDVLTIATSANNIYNELSKKK